MARILIAEDDVSTRKAVAMMVGKMGHVAVVSPDGQHAWETLQVDSDIDLLITDVMMPRMDGRQLVQMLRGQERFAKLPVIIMSAAVGPKDIFFLLELGAARFQPKPLSMVTLKENIEACLVGEEAQE